MHGFNKELKQKYRDYFSSNWGPSGKHATWDNMRLNQKHSRADCFLNRVLGTEEWDCMSFFKSWLNVWLLGYIFSHDPQYIVYIGQLQDNKDSLQCFLAVWSLIILCMYLIPLDLRFLYTWLDLGAYTLLLCVDIWFPQNHLKFLEFLVKFTWP